MDYHSLDIQWGKTMDILWMGAAAGSEACIAQRHSCFRCVMPIPKTLESGYGISLLPLASFRHGIVYGDDPCTQFLPKTIRGFVYFIEGG